MALAKDTSARRLVSIAERAATEGELYGPAFGQENVTISDGFAVSNVTLLSLSRAFYVESVTLSSNRLALMQVTLGSNPTQSLLQVVNRVMVAAGITQKSASMEWKTRGYFQAKGVRLRVINKSVSGSTTSDHELRRAAGVYDFPHVDYLHYQLGTNDAGAGTSSPVAQSNLAATIAWKQQRYPNATLVVYGSTPRENSTFETNLIAIRTAQAAAVTAAADPKVLYTSLASAFDRTNSANFAGSDTAGDRVHPSDAGHAGAYALVSAFLTSNNVAP
jgi:lysophospholipase L1-like esterase